MPKLPPNCKSRLSKFRRKGIPVSADGNEWIVNDPDTGIAVRQLLGRDPHDSLARVVRKAVGKRVVNILKDAAPAVPGFKGAVFLTPKDTFCVEIRAHFGGGLGIDTCETHIFEAWPSREAIACIGRELEAPYKHILHFCAFLGTTKQSWHLQDKVVSILGCEISATADGKIALEIRDPVTNYDNVRRVLLMLRRGYPRYLSQFKASLSHPQEEASEIVTELNLV